jgi:hypothetical protein
MKKAGGLSAPAGSTRLAANRFYQLFLSSNQTASRCQAFLSRWVHQIQSDLRWVVHIAPEICPFEKSFISASNVRCIGLVKR